MAVVRHHHYTVDPGDVEELIARRAKLIAAIRSTYPGLVEARLTRLDDGTFTDVWRWDTSEHMRAAFAAMRTIPEVGPAMSLVRDNNPQNGEIIDER